MLDDATVSIVKTPFTVPAVLALMRLDIKKRKQNIFFFKCVEVF